MKKNKNTREVVVNKCYGGFSLSDKATLLLRKWGHKGAIECVMGGETYPSGEVCDCSFKNSNHIDINRDDPLLVKVVKKLGKEANGNYSKLDIVTIPDNVEWEIDEYDGMEQVAEKHRTWG